MITRPAAATRSGQRGRVASGMVVAALIAGGPLTAGAAGPPARLELDHELTRPHLLTGDIADVIVSVRGSRNCTGILIGVAVGDGQPATGTNFVATAAHCVLDDDGEVTGSRTVMRHGLAYRAVAVLTTPAYHDSPSPRLDAAVLVTAEIIPGPTATLGDELPAGGLATLAGLQPLDRDGSLLRGTRFDNRPHPTGSPAVVQIESAAVGCVSLVSAFEISDAQVKVRCGLILGASGGGLFVEPSGRLFLVGIVSTVAADLTYNGVVPLDAMRELLEHPATYRHEVDGGTSTPSAARTIRS